MVFAMPAILLEFRAMLFAYCKILGKTLAPVLARPVILWAHAARVFAMPVILLELLAVVFAYSKMLGTALA